MDILQKSQDLLEEIIYRNNLYEIYPLNDLSKTQISALLAGKSRSGKTSFLRCLLNLEEYKFFPQGYIIKFTYHEDMSVRIDKEWETDFRDSEKFEEFFSRFSDNEDKDIIEFGLPSHILTYYSFSDMPGDIWQEIIERKGVKLEAALAQYDFIVFFKRFNEQLAPFEYEFLKKISQKMLIPYIVVFSFVDFRDEAIITNNQLYTYLKEKIEVYPNTPQFFVISNKFCKKNPSKSGIPKLETYLISEYRHIKESSVKNKIKYLVKYYEHALDVILKENQRLMTQQLSGYEMQSKIGLKRKETDLKMKYTRIKNELNSITQDFLQRTKELLFSKNCNEEDFKSLWQEMKSKTASLFVQEKICEFELPTYDSKVFEGLLMLSLEEIEEIKKLWEKWKGEKKGIQEKLKNVIKKQPDQDTIENSLQFIKELGSLKAVNKLRLVINKWIFLEKLESYIAKTIKNCLIRIETNNRKELEKQTVNFESELKKFEKKLKEEYRIDSIKKDIEKLSEILVEL